MRRRLYTNKALTGTASPATVEELIQARGTAGAEQVPAYP
jgi:hypothetical protein